MNELKISINIENVDSAYKYAVSDNKKRFLEGDPTASEQYTYPNQKEDAFTILDIFRSNMYDKNSIRAISIIKRTKVGCDGLMIEIAKNISTHNDKNFIIFSDNIFFITGMSNKDWENDFKKKVPGCFKENIFHHGKLKNVLKKIKNIKNSLIIIDEIDTGDKEFQRLHTTLKESNLLDINYMDKNNIKFIFVSATIKNQLTELYKWGKRHVSFTMTVPKNYISHGDFLDKKIIKEFYDINNITIAEKWIQEDILDEYNEEYRIHIIRTDLKKIKYIEEACKNKKIKFKNHFSENRISKENLEKLFESELDNHYVIAVKGFYRRANLIPNKWKMKIGAVHERYSKKVDTSVQVQGLPGRMTGYWKDDIINKNHKTGPYRTSINAIKQYEDFYKNPNNNHKYNTNGSKKTFISPKNIINLDYQQDKDKNEKIEYKIFDNQDDAIEFAKTNLNTKHRKKETETKAPKELLDKDGNNPSVNYLIKRAWGLNSDKKSRLIKTNKNKWCLYWKPS
jgi:hypothetical protein